MLRVTSRKQPVYTFARLHICGSTDPEISRSTHLDLETSTHQIRIRALRAHAGGGLRSGGLATAPKCILQDIMARSWRRHGLLQHPSPRHTPKTYTAVEIQNPTSTKPPLRKARALRLAARGGTPPEREVAADAIRDASYGDLALLSPTIFSDKKHNLMCFKKSCQRGEIPV